MNETPNATYRLQLRPGFGFDEAAAVVPYLAALGVSDVYFSPYLQAAPGSTHGYDVVDHSRVNEELGGADAHARLVAALQAHGLGQIVDVVPNHMSIASRRNRWWWDVLENGPSSRFARFFDVDWQPNDPRFQNQTLLPILGDHYGRVLEEGHLRVIRSGSKFTVRAYEDHEMPASPTSMAPILAEAARRLDDDELSFAADVLSSLPLPSSTDPESIQRRHRDQSVIGRQLARLFASRPEIADTVDEVVAQTIEDVDLLDAFLQRQNYRLAYWRTARQDLDYRRFFDINTLAALRVELDEVFDSTHALPLAWMERGEVRGLRIDHPDGLLDPEGYTRRLREAAPGAWIVVEKILELDEELPERWPVDGTTGYEFSGLAGGLLVRADAETSWTSAWQRYVPEAEDFEAIVHRSKRRVLDQLLASDLARLTSALRRVCEEHRSYRDYVDLELRRALRSVISHFQVYRTYVRSEESPSPFDVAQIGRALAAAEAEEALSTDLGRFLGAVLRNEVSGQSADQVRGRFQQLCSAVMAKGQEDTSFYVYTRFIGLNDVGSDPTRFGVSPDLFHFRMERAQVRSPVGMTNTSTHDTKRSEDVRARLAVLSEVTPAWSEAVDSWTKALASHIDPVLDRSTLWYFFQTLVGTWPIDVDRLGQHMEKAIREAKTHTSWTEPDAGYEAAVRRLVQGALENADFVDGLERFVAELRPAGRRNALVLKALALTAPGVPDIYQGTELHRDDLTDPDNRRPVNFAELGKRLERLQAGAPAADDDDRKLDLVRRLLELRSRRADVFGPLGSYRALRPTGPGADHAVAFRRGPVVVVAGRWWRSADEALAQAELALEKEATDVLSGRTWPAGTHRLDGILAAGPVAVLEEA